ncbi:MAG: hypothetical protein NTY91_04435 [Euryarchaeota archaeon]|nr:hypothetical protein [Euryarchaeota archaeon]
MKTILRRKDNTSIFCPPICKHRTSGMAKTKSIELTIACAFIITGLCIIFISL